MFNLFHYDYCCKLILLHISTKSVECSIYTPYRVATSESVPFVVALLSLLRQCYPNCEIEWVGMKTEYFEQIIPVLPYSTIIWAEYCHTYILQSNLSNVLKKEISLPEGYSFCTLQ